MLTRKHYEAIARILDNSYHNWNSMTPDSGERFGLPIRDISFLLADYFEKDNPRFNRDKFLEACGVE